MRTFFVPAVILAGAVLFSIIARTDSPGVIWRETARDYSQALAEGRADEALGMMTYETAAGLCPEFMESMQGVPPPADFVYSGSDADGILMSGVTESSGTRVIWLLVDGKDVLVQRDTAIDNLLGSAVMLCRQRAADNPQGSCPVSGAPYEYDRTTGTVYCPSGHLGAGIIISSDRCALKRDSVAAELNRYLDAGFEYPASLEDIHVNSGGEFGRRGGYSCPDNGYKYYELRDGMVYCPFHEEYSPPEGAL